MACALGRRTGRRAGGGRVDGPDLSFFSTLAEFARARLEPMPNLHGPGLNLWDTGQAADV